jgi:hypothetical protein
MTLINGPINAIRLQGKINNIDKVIYIFCDMHFEQCEQTQCNDIESEDFHKYLYKFINEHENTEINYDIFFESSQNNMNENSLRMKYIVEFTKFFWLIKKIKNNNKNKYKNIRMHYIDIRKSMYDYNKILKKIKHVINDNIFLNNDKLNYLIDLYSKLQYELTDFYNSFDNDYNNNNNNNNNYDNKLINKIKNKYDNEQVKNIMKCITQDLIFVKTLNKNNSIEKIKKHIEQINSFLKIPKNNKYTIKKLNITTSDIYYESDSQKIHYEIKTYNEYLSSILMNDYAKLMDIYAIRRFIDKNYITNCICYTGAYHSMTYVYALVKYFNFEITHAHNINNSKEMNLIETTKYIKNMNICDHFILESIFFPLYILQCVDLSIFPKNFA